jgi:GH18 family chitinase
MPETLPPESSLPPGTPLTPVDSADGFKVVAYYPFWKYNQIDKVQFDVVTHAIYAFALPKADGTLKPLENEASAKQLIETAHQNGKYALLGVGGWSDNGVILEAIFEEATSSDEKIRTFAEAIVTMCDTYGFDGVDIDWEYPRTEDGTWQQYEKLMVLLGEKLHSQNKVLTAAVISGVYQGGWVSVNAAAQTDTVLQTVDWINIMAYEGDDGSYHSTYEMAVASSEYWHITRNLPAEKVVLGVPFYAKPTNSSYESILQANPDAASLDSFTMNGTPIWYNGIPTIQQKTRYAKDTIGGVMIWEITQDTSDLENSLVTAIGEAME